MSASSLPQRLPEVLKEKLQPFRTEKCPLPIFQFPLVDEELNVPGCRRFSFGEENMDNKQTARSWRALAGQLPLQTGEGGSGGDAGCESDVEVTVYRLNYQDGFQVNYTLTIIDTPGFGDTRGIERDQLITEQIRELFTAASGVSDIDAVCIVVPSSLPAPHAIAEDIEENIRVLVTFADGQRPPVLEAITASEVPCPKKNKIPLHFKFNNSALFANNNLQRKSRMRKRKKRNKKKKRSKGLTRCSGTWATEA
ncbi:hypothetical protein WMY93_007458 [Mugilogobius chulae]|uniref:Septin-type G domain-containing protein n=1 Tax=Mugilogobius chulae TaxID=88201 RepID=A0AAW0PGF8_9GOBI